MYRIPLSVVHAVVCLATCTTMTKPRVLCGRLSAFPVTVTSMFRAGSLLDSMLCRLTVLHALGLLSERCDSHQSPGLREVTVARFGLAYSHYAALLVRLPVQQDHLVRATDWPQLS